MSVRFPSAFAAAALLLASPAAAQEVAERALDPDSGHTYLRTPQPLTFFEAEALAHELGGELVAVGSGAEETLLLDNFGADEGYWIGLEFPRERWATGEALGFVHWAAGEPGRGADAPFTLLNGGEPGSWHDATGEAASERFRALIELDKGIGPPAQVPAAPSPRAERGGVLLCAVQGLVARDLEASKYPNLNELWKRSAWTFDAGADGSLDPLANLGMLAWGVGSARSGLRSAAPSSARAGVTLLARLESALGEVATAALLDDPALGGALVPGRVDLRVANASPRKGGTLAPAQDALARPTPLCVLATWTRIALNGADEAEASHAKELAAVDKELGALLAALRARPSFAQEDWWIAVAGLEPAPSKKKGGELDPRARTAVPLLIVANGAPPGEILSEVGLVDLVPTALAHLGLLPRRSFALDGRALVLGTPARYGTNLLANGGAEAQLGWFQGDFPVLTGWRALAPFRISRHGASAPKELGASYFSGGSGSLARAEQTLDLTALAEDIDRGAVRFELAARLGTQKRAPARVSCAVEFLSEQRKSLASSVLGPIGRDALGEELGYAAGDSRAELLARTTSGKLPRKTRLARVILLAEGEPSVEQTAADELSLVLERE
ncbi:MAG: hypothetical protein EXS08_06425 [Planctomycetes bacterium]|nr:hypothetical protein [Planctomycetota bacterium]